MPANSDMNQILSASDYLRQSHENSQTSFSPRLGARSRRKIRMATPSDFHFNVGLKHSVIILCRSKARCQDFKVIADACECVVVNANWQLGRQDDIAAQPKADFLMVELLSISEEAEQSLSELALYLQQNASQILLWTDMGLLETAYATLPNDRSHFLVNANDGDAMPILAGALSKMAADQLHDSGRQSDFGALHRISDELAQFARTLALMAEGGDRSAQVSDKPVSFRPAPPDAFRDFVTGSAEPKVTAATIRQIIKLRRMRDSYFDSSLFADPAWDILLDLMAARLEGVQVSVSSLCIAAAVPATTALRWIGTMTESGLLVREHDPDDARRIFIGLADETADSLHRFFNDIQRRPSMPV